MSIYFSFSFLSKLLAIDLESISVLLLCGKQIFYTLVSEKPAVYF